MPESALTRQRQDVVDLRQDQTTPTSSADACRPLVPDADDATSADAEGQTLPSSFSLHERFNQYIASSRTRSGKASRPPRPKYVQYCATQEAAHEAGIVPLDPAIAAKNIRESVRPCASKKHEAMLAELNCLGPAGTSEGSPAHMVQMSAFPNQSLGISLQKKMVIVSPAMLEKSEGYRQTGVLPLYSECDWTRRALAAAGPASSAYVQSCDERTPDDCDPALTLFRIQTMAHSRQQHNTPKKAGGLDFHQDSHFCTQIMPALTHVTSVLCEEHDDGTTHYLSDDECREKGIPNSKIVLGVPAGLPKKDWQEFESAVPYLAGMWRFSGLDGYPGVFGRGRRPRA